MGTSILEVEREEANPMMTPRGLMRPMFAVEPPLDTLQPTAVGLGPYEPEDSLVAVNLLQHGRKDLIQSPEQGLGPLTKSGARTFASRRRSMVTEGRRELATTRA